MPQEILSTHEHCLIALRWLEKRCFDRFCNKYEESEKPAYNGIRYLIQTVRGAHVELACVFAAVEQWVFSLGSLDPTVQEKTSMDKAIEEQAISVLSRMPQYIQDSELNSLWNSSLGNDKLHALISHYYYRSGRKDLGTALTVRSCCLI